MPVEATSLLDKFKTQPAGAQTTEQKTAQPQVKTEEKPDEIVISKEAKPKKTTAHYVGKGAGIGAIVGLTLSVGLYLFSVGKNLIKGKLSFKDAIKPFEKIEYDYKIGAEGMERTVKAVTREWQPKALASITGVLTALSTLGGNIVGAVTGLIKNRKSDKAE